MIRWIKGDGLDDPVTRAAIGQATRLFGDRVDYCVCTQGIDAARARSILSWANQPVEWWPVSENDNPRLAAFLRAAGCPPERFGYWWKWFPERVRPDGPEWILDGDMVVTAAPPWFDDWAAGVDGVRVAQDDKEGMHIYGHYAPMVDAHAFRRDNPDFERLVAAGTIYSTSTGDTLDRHRWLGGMGPWGVPGWTMPTTWRETSSHGRRR